MEPETTTNPVEVEDDIVPTEPEVETDDADQSDETEAEEVEEYAEVERQGKRYKIPKALEAELLMQADYTRKTQEIAELRKMTEAQRADLIQTAELQQQFLDDVASVRSVEQQLAYFKDIDWPAYQRQDPQGAQADWFQYQALKDQHEDLNKSLQAKKAEWNSRIARERDTEVEKALAEVKKAIPDWSPQKAAEVTEFAKTNAGLTDAELAEITNPRVITALHEFMLLKRADEQRRAAAKLKRNDEIKPTPTVSGGTPRKALDDRRSVDDWMAARTKQLRARS